MISNLETRREGLYVPEMESDACGTGLIANLNGIKSNKIVQDALQMLVNMEHRGACGCEPNSGDGAGILTQVPHEFFVIEAQKNGFNLPNEGEYGVGLVFMPAQKELRKDCKIILNDYIDQLGFNLLGYRDVPVDNSDLGDTAKSVEPFIQQVFVMPKKAMNEQELERKLYILRKHVTHIIHETYPETQDHFYFTTFSHKTIGYKGQLRTMQVGSYYLDLQQETYKSAIALIHSRFSTNTVPKWKLAQPFRYIAHNGEINTVQGNYNWWTSKERLLASNIFTEEELKMLYPICGKGHSDSGTFDNVLEFLVLSGRSLPHALMMMIPEAWQEDKQMDDTKRSFYEYNQAFMEPWDGPASVCFTDGKLVGATLDRNGLRPSRYSLSEDNVLIVASEAGALPVDESKIVLKGRLQPGKILVADLSEGRIIGDEELKQKICSEKPYRKWLDENRVHLNSLPSSNVSKDNYDDSELIQKQLAFGYTREDIRMYLTPLIDQKYDPTGSMGTDTPLAVLSDQAQHLSNYFKQLFAQVTNPPIDPIRERSVMSIFSYAGRMFNILDPKPESARQIHLDNPVLSNEELSKLKHINHPFFKSSTLSTLFNADGEEGRLESAIDSLCHEAEHLVRTGSEILILSDRDFSKSLAPIPSLLIVGAIHHHLIKKGLRAKTSIIVESGDVREAHHFATLIGFGASAINPYMAYVTLSWINREGYLEENYADDKDVFKIYSKAINGGLLKIFSKNGISTLHSYQGSQIFECLGLGEDVIEKCFKGCISRIGGMSFDEIAEEALVKLRLAYPDKPVIKQRLEVGGVYQWKRQGEAHLFNPQTIHLLQHSTRYNKYDTYKKYAELINDQATKAITVRGLFDFRKGTPISIEEVEPAENIYRRFATGAMSFGSISYEAHTTLAVAMNRIGGKSNSGEGGEDEIRYERKENGDWERSAIKQVASGRFGVTSYYLTNADEIQIKMAQGAKPGEGGQLPGHKVDDWIGRVRHSTPGVGLISPPPHHDIYSIEDLSQLISDLKNANRAARINVKLVSKAGVGVIASGVAKAKADVVLIAGHDGGTGASPITSIRHAGLPWELGLAETHQTLVRNKLRSRITVQTDGQIRTGRDIAIATLLGAEEYGIATAALVVEGCIMMRKCHLNTCPVGIATQNPDLRKRYTGEPDHVINFFKFLVQDLREIMAELGFKTIDEMVGRSDMLKVRDGLDHKKYKNLNLSSILHKEDNTSGETLYKSQQQDHEIDDVLDWKLIEAAKPALEQGQGVSANFKIINTDRSTGTMLSNEISKIYKGEGLPEGTINFKFKGSAGQSFGGFAASGIHFSLEGESNDYFGKGLSGGRLAVYPHAEAKFEANKNMIIGNVAFYGATSGEAYINGLAGERFCVRNSGAKAVVEGIGDHGCEYMTGGLAIILGETGKNFAAGMSGGIAFIYDKAKSFVEKCNQELVDLDPLSDEDQLLLKQMIENHKKFTNSALATEILANWNNNFGYFIKVMPRDYKRVILEKAAKAKALASR